MKKTTTAIIVTGALVMGLVLGSVGLAAAAPVEAVPAETGTLHGMGLRMGQAIRDAGARLINVVADLTGMSKDEILDQVQDGKSLPAIAEANGVGSDELIGGLFDSRKAILDERVADGQITQEQADWALETMRDRIEDRVLSDRMGPGFGGQGGGGHGFMGQGGFNGPPGGGFGDGPGACWGYPADDASDA